MIQYITAIIFELMSAAPNRELYRDADAREQIASYVVDAGDRYNQPPDFLAVWFFGESSLRSTAVGARGEVGTAQIHPSNFALCSSAGHDIDTAKGQIMCGAMIADMMRRKCGSFERGWFAYATRGGKCTGSKKAKEIFSRRSRQLKRINNKVRRKDGKR